MSPNERDRDSEAEADQERLRLVYAALILVCADVRSGHWMGNCGSHRGYPRRQSRLARNSDHWSGYLFGGIARRTGCRLARVERHPNASAVRTNLRGNEGGAV